MPLLTWIVLDQDAKVNCPFLLEARGFADDTEEAMKRQGSKKGRYKSKGYELSVNVFPVSEVQLEFGSTAFLVRE
ncbi:hypothetical protein DV515_00009819 [Chloebia gouldiae]|uniref:Uncharacterized protein n=1 Tax=Chloebia gouldiae TaxID=44316 RepID=A0A3L8SB90_CHLGU|nr:hypothetical protein DV515_00009819 [Chloebia gouldiae]